MSNGSRVPVVVFVLAAVGVGAAWYWLRAPVAPPEPPPLVEAPAPEPVPPDAAAEPAIRHPLAPAEGETVGLADADAYAKAALEKLLGRKAVRTFLTIEDFARRFVATVDNLGRASASPGMWPVKLTLGDFEIEEGADGAVIAAHNAERYAPLVRLLTAVQTQRAVRVYRRLYPAFQAAYEDLGYPGQYFNDRMVEVIDLLLATPTPEGPIAVRRIDTGGGANVFVFADEDLERLAAGQKILLRIGADNTARVKAKLTELRAQIASQ